MQITMKTIKIWNNKAQENQLNEISAVICNGGLVIVPTDTVYAIVADAFNNKSVERLCRLKGINPEKTNLSLICSDISMAAEYCKINNSAFRMLKELTPGPFTFLFKGVSNLPKAFKGRKIVGVRIPDCEIDRELAAKVGHPLLTTGISFKDEDYAVNPELIMEAYENKVDMMVIGEDGTTDLSTIIDVTDNEPVIIREGKGKL